MVLDLRGPLGPPPESSLLGKQMGRKARRQSEGRAVGTKGSQKEGLGFGGLTGES